MTRPITSTEALSDDALFADADVYEYDITLPTWVTQWSDAALADEYGVTTFQRGQQYAADGHVVKMSISVDATRIIAKIQGTASSLYTTEIRCDDPVATTIPTWTDRCSCPMREACKHVVATVLTLRTLLHHHGATEQLEDLSADAQHDGDLYYHFSPAALPTSSDDDTHPRHLPNPHWRDHLGRALTSPRPAHTNTHDADARLGLRLQPAVDAHLPTTPLNQRGYVLKVCRLGKNGTWNVQPITWSSLDHVTRYSYHQPRLHHGDAAHLAEFHRIATSLQERLSWGDTPLTLENLHRDAWPAFLRLAAHVPILYYHNKTHTPIEVIPAPQHPVLDATRQEQHLTIRPALQCGAELQHLGPLDAYLGTPPAALLMHHPETHARTLVPLSEPIPSPLADLLRHPAGITVPAADAPEFVTAYLPRLRRQLPVVSSDNTVPIVDAAPPRLLLQLHYRHAWEAHLAWHWQYTVGDATTTYPLGEPPNAIRDTTTEQRILTHVCSHAMHDHRPLLTYSSGQMGLTNPATLTGEPCRAFTTHALPALRECDDVDVHVDGVEPTYAEAADVDVAWSVTDHDGPTPDGTDVPGTDWFDLGVTVTVHGHPVPVARLVTALTTGDDVQFDDGTWLAPTHPALQPLRELLAEAAHLVNPETGTVSINRWQIGLWEHLAASGTITAQSDAWRATIDAISSLTHRETPPVPNTVQAQLRPYQHDGYAWLTALWETRLGGILADDMGLGKTLQILTLLAHAHHRGDLTRPALVVAPTSVLTTWASQAAQFTPHLRVAVVDQTVKRAGTPLADTVEGAHIVVTSYTLARIDAPHLQALEWSALILDEAQSVKNPDGVTFSALYQLRAPRRLAVTGTPLENNLLDLFALFALAAPGVFPRRDSFTEYYRRPIESGKHPERLTQLRTRITPLMLRRTKELVASDLPPKHVQVLQLPLDTAHDRLYQRQLAHERQTVMGLLADGKGHQRRIQVLAALTRLRRLALHASFAASDVAAQPAPSVKLRVLVERLVEVVGEGHKALVFSQFTDFLTLARNSLEQAGLTCSYLDGTTRARQRVIAEFTSGASDVFLISLKAGGVGLTLTEADYVFVLDPWWNPAAENQAIDRAHRIGQTKPVMVYRLMAAGTIEEKVMALQARKQALFDSVMDDDAFVSSTLTDDDIRALLN